MEDDEWRRLPARLIVGFVVQAGYYGRRGWSSRSGDVEDANEDADEDRDNNEDSSY